MATISVIVGATGSTTPITSYDSTRWNLGTLIKQFTGASPTDRYIGPHKTALARPFEESTAFQLLHLDSFSWSSRYDWVFGLESSAAASATRRIMAYQYDRNTSSYSWLGFITVTLNTSTAHTLRGFKMSYYTHSTGTVDVSGTTVNGTSTLFQDQRIAVGARIGFGTTDPTQVTQWYYISGITNNTTLTITLSAGIISAGTSYVIEELRSVITTSNATVANGGLFVTKGITINDFTPVGTTIAASAAGTDNLKLTYWLKDITPTITNTAPGGAAIDSNTQTNFNGLTHSLFVLDTNNRCYRYNLRANNTIASGVMSVTSSNIVTTGVQAHTGTLGQVNNGIIKTVNHGSGNGVKSLYYITTTRFYRADVNNITQGNITWQSDNRTEVPPGGVNTQPTTSLLQQLEYDSITDRFIAMTTNATAFRSYYTQYPTNSGDQFEYSLFNDFKLFDGSTTDLNSVALPFNTNSTSMICTTNNGITHILRLGTAVIGQHALFAVPIAAHWDFASTTNQVAISPAISTPNNSKFYKISVNTTNSLGTGQFFTPLNDVRFFYRTSGISDNSGLWNSITPSGELSITGTSQIQFRFEFQMLGQVYGIPARLHDFVVTYEDESTLSNYQPSVTYSDETNKRFAWRFATSFGTTVPALRVRLYDAVSGGLLVDDNTSSPTGTFQESTDDGVSWSAWTDADKTNNTTYLRYQPASLADNIKVRALLTQN
jgi:hypothetical protein